MDDSLQRAEAAEAEVREILVALKRHCADDFVVITDGAIDWSQTIAEFVSFVTKPKSTDRNPFFVEIDNEGKTPI